MIHRFTYTNERIEEEKQNIIDVIRRLTYIEERDGKGKIYN